MVSGLADGQASRMTATSAIWFHVSCLGDDHCSRKAVCTARETSNGPKPRMCQSVGPEAGGHPGRLQRAILTRKCPRCRDCITGARQLPWLCIQQTRDRHRRLNDDGLSSPAIVSRCDFSPRKVTLREVRAREWNFSNIAPSYPSIFLLLATCLSLSQREN